MNRVLKIVAGLAFATAAAAQPAPAENARGAAELGKRLEGLVAGTPTPCVDKSDIRSTSIVDGTAIVFEAPGRIYVNRPAAGAKLLRRSDTLVSNTQSPQLCKVDDVRLYQDGFPIPIALGDFVPYARPAR
jgi:hypothetical protein